MMAGSPVPLKLRKQMLLMRAAVERVELAHHLADVRRAATISAIVRNALPSDGSRGLAARAFELAKRFPFIASAASIIAARFKLPLLKGAVKWGGLVALGYKLWEAWQQRHPTSAASSSRPPRRLGGSR